MLRSSLLLAVLVALGGLAFSPDAASGDEPLAPAKAKATHTLTIDYEQTRGNARRAMLKIAPKGDDVRPLWRGELHSISVLTTDKRWIIIESFLSSDHSTGHHAEARVMMPAPENISAILLRPKRGETLGWKVEEGESYTEVEWTYFSQQGRKIPPPTPLEANGDDDDECGPIPAGCEVYNPWTCQCDIGLKDPWGDEFSSSQVVLGL